MFLSLVTRVSSEIIFLDESLTLHNIPSVNTCPKPDITNGVVTPDTATVDFQSSYTVACVEGYTVSAEGAMLCQADNRLDTVHACIGKYSKRNWGSYWRH